MKPQKSINLDLRDIQPDTSKGIMGNHFCQMSDNSSLNLVKFDFSISVLIKARNKKNSERNIVALVFRVPNYGNGFVS